MKPVRLLYWSTMFGLLAYINWPEQKPQEIDVRAVIVELQHQAEGLCTETARKVYGETAVAEIRCVDTSCTCEIEIEGEQEREPEGQNV